MKQETTMRHEFIPTEEYADLRQRRTLSPAFEKSFRRYLARLPKPPQGATLAVCQMWHEERLRKTPAHHGG